MRSFNRVKLVQLSVHSIIMIDVFASASQACNVFYQLQSCSNLFWFHDQGIPEDLGIHHIVVNDWERGVDADQNVVLISVPSVLSPNLAPPGKHVLHAYTPGTEPFELWEGLDRRSNEYKELKAQRSEVSSTINQNFQFFKWHCCLIKSFSKFSLCNR